MPEGSPGTGFDIRRLFSPGTQAREGREDPRTEPHAPVHAAPENPTPITLEDMSDQGGVGSVSKAEATLTHPSARDNEKRRPKTCGNGRSHRRAKRDKAAKDMRQWAFPRGPPPQYYPISTELNFAVRMGSGDPR